MVDINATVIVQAFNFFIAYLILRFFLCKPAVKVIEQEQVETEHLQSLTEERTQILAQTVAEKEAAWKDFQVLFSQEVPQVTRRHMEKSGVEPVQTIDHLDEQQLAQLSQALQHEIIEKVQHVK